MKYKDFEVGSIIKISSKNGTPISEIIKISDNLCYDIPERVELKYPTFDPTWEFERGHIKDFATETILSIIHDLCIRIN